MAIGFWSLGGFIIGLLALPRRVAVVDKVASALQPGLAHEGVFVERGLFNNARGVEEVGTIADRARRIERVVHRNPVDLQNEVGLRIEHQAETVADRSTAWLKRNIARLSGSRGSCGLPPALAQPASVPARSSAAHSLMVLATRSAFNPCLLFAVSFGSFIVQELTDEMFEHHSGL